MPDNDIEAIALVLLTSPAYELDEAGARVHLEATEHSGDCTKDPWSCLRCIADEARDSARAALACIIERWMEPDERLKEVAATWLGLNPNEDKSATEALRLSMWQAMLKEKAKEVDE